MLYAAGGPAQNVSWILHLVMPRYVSVEDAHKMCDHLEQDIKDKLPNTRITIHVEPCVERLRPLLDHNLQPAKTPNREKSNQRRRQPIR